MSYDLNRCRACHEAEWREDIEKVAYWKNFHGIRVQDHVCLECSKKQHTERLAAGWQVDDKI